MNFIVISFYRYTQIKDPNELCTNLKKACAENQILGRILIAEEGINGAVCGRVEGITKFKDYLHCIPELRHLTFREQIYEKNSYHKLVVKVRSEICAFKTTVNPQNAAPYITSDELNKLYQNQEEFVIVDARNDYEYEVGKFRNAVPLNIHNFREFASAEKILKQHRDKKIILYCTGGIRCEKASAYLKEKEYPNVYHLKGGIIEYLNKQNDTQNTSLQQNIAKRNNWEGGLFVFDDRLVSPSDSQITTCTHCNIPTEQYHNCNNINCDKLFITCEKCYYQNGKCCSETCKNSPKQRIDIPQLELKGKVENYYPKKQVAYIKTSAKIKIGDKIIIKGKTTNTKTTITRIVNEKGTSIETAEPGECVTVEINTIARKNDKMYSVI